VTGFLFDPMVSYTEIWTVPPQSPHEREARGEAQYLIRARPDSPVCPLHSLSATRRLSLDPHDESPRIHPA